MRRLRWLLLVPCLLIGCTDTGATASPATASGPTPPPTAPAAPATGSPGPSESAMGSEPAPAAALTQPWATANLTDVRTREPFRIADLVAGGQVVFVETMAIWCTSCYREQQEAVIALDRLDPARVAWVALDVESSESAEALARYSEDNGFDFQYAIADADLSRALASEFGDQVLNPPSVNVIVISPDGRISPSRGHRTADELVELALEHGAAVR